MKKKMISKIYRQNAIETFLNKSNLSKDLFKNSLNKKVKIDTGKFCNAKCNFCYYFDSLHINDLITLNYSKNKPFLELIKKGIDYFEFSGGEPTLNKELPNIIKYLINFKQNLKFGIVTNGWKLKEFIKTLEANNLLNNLDSILISLHGDLKEHDSITKLNGSYTKILENIDTIQTLYKHIKIRINIVVINQNITNTFINLINVFLKRGIQINLLPLNFWMDSNLKKISPETNLFKILESIDYKKLIILNTYYKMNFGSNILNIRYYQICKLPPKYSKFIINHFGHFFDKLDWNKLFYPNENLILNKDDINRLNNYNLENNLDIESVKRVYINDSELSHQIDSICKNCIQFKILKCDGVKYSNQITLETNESSLDLEHRKKYVLQQVKEKKK